MFPSGGLHAGPTRAQPALPEGRAGGSRTAHARRPHARRRPATSADPACPKWGGRAPPGPPSRPPFHYEEDSMSSAHEPTELEQWVQLLKVLLALVRQL